MADLRAHERQAAEELGQWVTTANPAVSMTERLNVSRRRAREAWEGRQGAQCRTADGGVNRGRPLIERSADIAAARGMTERLTAGPLACAGKIAGA